MSKLTLILLLFISGLAGAQQSAPAATFECMRGGYTLPLASIDDSYVTTIELPDGKKAVKFAVDRWFAAPLDSPSIYEFTGHRTIRGVMVVFVVRFDMKARTYAVALANWDREAEWVTCDSVLFTRKF